MNLLRRFLYGRNGPDHLGIAVLFLGLLLSITARLVLFEPARSVLNLVEYACTVYFFFRVLSRNVYKRQQENAWFMTLFRSLSGGLRVRTAAVRDLRHYKYMKCPDCGLRLRAPRGRGRIRVTCQRCSACFERTV